VTEPSAGNDESDRRARLRAVKLHALVRDHLATSDGGVPDLTVGSFAPGAALTAGDAAWVLIDPASSDGRGLGPALVWASRRGVTSLHVVAEQGAGVVARRAAEFTVPTTVWNAEGRSLRPADTQPIGPPAEASADHLRFVPDIEAAGAVPLIEFGVVAGEVRGLEVCRVVDADGANGIEARLDVGVGVHDREAFAIMHAGVPIADALANVVASVTAVRDVSVPAHPLNRLAPERFLRWRLEQEPWLVGMALVRPAQPPVPRINLKDRAACTARGARIDGSEVVIVCSVGADLDVIPYAADARLAAESDPGADAFDAIVVTPLRDLMPVTEELANLLRHPVSLMPLPAG